MRRCAAASPRLERSIAAGWVPGLDLLLGLALSALACVPAPPEAEAESPAPPSQDAGARSPGATDAAAAPDPAVLPRDPAAAPDAALPQRDGASPRRDTSFPPSDGALRAADASVGGTVAPDPIAVVFSLARVHEIDIVIEPKDVPMVEVIKAPRVPCRFTFDGVVLENVGIRQKGGGFVTNPARKLGSKPGLTLKFDEFVKGQRLHGLKELVLNNGHQDKALVSEHIIYELARRAGLPAAHTAYAVVTINGFVEGIYVMKEGIGKQFLARNFGPGNDEGNLYEGNYSAPLKRPVIDFVLAPKTIPLDDEVKDGRRRDDIIELANRIQGATDADFEAKVSEKMDLSRFITSFALDALVADFDDYSFNTNNYYVYDNPADGRFVLIAIGLDVGLGGPFYPITRSPFGPPKGRLAVRVRAIPGLDARYRDEVLRLNREILDTPATRARLDHAEALMQTITRKDAKTLADLAAFRAGLPVTRDFIAKRAQYLK